MRNSLLLIIIISFIFAEETCITTKEYSYFRNQDMSEEDVWDNLRNKATKEFFKENFTFFYSKTERNQQENNNIYQDDYSSYNSFVSAGQIEIKRVYQNIDGSRQFATFEICYDAFEINKEIQQRIKETEEEKIIAVVGFVSEGLTSTKRNLFKDKLEEQIKQISPYELLSYQKVDRILKESGKITTEQCNEAACAVDLGRDLNVDFVLQPNIIFEDEGLESTIGLTIFDVETGKVVAKLFEFDEFRGFNDLLRSLDKYVMDLIIKATGGYSSNVSTIEERQSASNGYISINTEPQGATILLDSEDVGKSNRLLSNIDPGEHIVVLSLPGYTRVVKRINVSPGQTTTIDEILLKDMGALSVSTNPRGAKIYLNGKYKGTTDNVLSLSYLEIGDYRLTASYNNYEEYVGTVTVEKDRTNDVVINLDPIPAKVRIFSTPSNAEIYLNGDYIGLTESSGFLATLSPGSYKITLKSEDYFEEEEMITTYPGGSDIVDLNLRRLPKGRSSNKNMGFVSTNIYPENSLIKINNKKINESTLDYHQLLKGKYNLKISSPGFRSYKTKFEILPQKHNDLKKVTLNPLDLDVAYKRSMIFPGLGHFYAEEYGKGTAWMFGTFASLMLINASVADYFDKDQLHDEAFDAYNAAVDNIPVYAAAYEDAFDDREKSMYMVIGSIGSLVGIWTGNIFEFKKTLSKYNKIYGRLNYNKVDFEIKF